VATNKQWIFLCPAILLSIMLMPKLKDWWEWWTDDFDSNLDHMSLLERKKIKLAREYGQQLKMK